MNRAGHVGIAVGAYAPFGYVVSTAGYYDLAVVGAVVTATLAPLPDLDRSMPFVRHRGYSHTVWSFLLVAVLCGGIGVRLGSQFAGTSPRLAGTVGVIAGGTAVGSHVAADALTPMGVRPFRPVGGRLALGVVRSSDRTANRILLWTGIAALGTALWAASGVR